MERAEAGSAVPDRVRLLDSGNADEARRGSGPALEAVQENLLGPDPDVADVRLENSLDEGCVVAVAAVEKVQ